MPNPTPRVYSAAPDTIARNLLNPLREANPGFQFNWVATEGAGDPNVRNSGRVVINSAPGGPRLRHQASFIAEELMNGGFSLAGVVAPHMVMVAGENSRERAQNGFLRKIGKTYGDNIQRPAVFDAMTQGPVSGVRLFGGLLNMGLQETLRLQNENPDLNPDLQKHFAMPFSNSYTRLSRETGGVDIGRTTFVLGATEKQIADSVTSAAGNSVRGMGGLIHTGTTEVAGGYFASSYISAADEARNSGFTEMGGRFFKTGSAYNPGKDLKLSQRQTRDRYVTPGNDINLRHNGDWSVLPTYNRMSPNMRELIIGAVAADSPLSKRAGLGEGRTIGSNELMRTGSLSATTWDRYDLPADADIGSLHFSDQPDIEHYRQNTFANIGMPNESKDPFSRLIGGWSTGLFSYKVNGREVHEATDAKGYQGRILERARFDLGTTQKAIKQSTDWVFGTDKLNIGVKVNGNIVNMTQEEMSKALSVRDDEQVTGERRDLLEGIREVYRDRAVAQNWGTRNQAGEYQGLDFIMPHDQRRSGGAGFRQNQISYATTGIIGSGDSKNIAMKGVSGWNEQISGAMSGQMMLTEMATISKARGILQQRHDWSMQNDDKYVDWYRGHSQGVHAGNFLPHGSLTWDQGKRDAWWGAVNEQVEASAARWRQTEVGQRHLAEMRSDALAGSSFDERGLFPVISTNASAEWTSKSSITIHDLLSDYGSGIIDDQGKADMSLAFMKSPHYALLTSMDANRRADSSVVQNFTGWAGHSAVTAPADKMRLFTDYLEKEHGIERNSLNPLRLMDEDGNARYVPHPSQLAMLHGDKDAVGSYMKMIGEGWRNVSAVEASDKLSAQIQETQRQPGFREGLMKARTFGIYNTFSADPTLAGTSTIEFGPSHLAQMLGQSGGDENPAAFLAKAGLKPGESGFIGSVGARRDPALGSGVTGRLYYNANMPAGPMNIDAAFEQAMGADSDGDAFKLRQFIGNWMKEYQDVDPMNMLRAGFANLSGSAGHEATLAHLNAFPKRSDENDKDYLKRIVLGIGAASPAEIFNPAVGNKTQNIAVDRMDAAKSYHNESVEVTQQQMADARTRDIEAKGAMGIFNMAWSIADVQPGAQIDRQLLDHYKEEISLTKRLPKDLLRGRVTSWYQIALDKQKLPQTLQELNEAFNFKAFSLSTSPKDASSGLMQADAHLSAMYSAKHPDDNTVHESLRGKYVHTPEEIALLASGFDESGKSNIGDVLQQVIAGRKRGDDRWSLVKAKRKGSFMHRMMNASIAMSYNAGIEEGKIRINAKGIPEVVSSQLDDEGNEQWTTMPAAAIEAVKSGNADKQMLHAIALRRRKMPDNALFNEAMASIGGDLGQSIGAMAIQPISQGQAAGIPDPEPVSEAPAAMEENPNDGTTASAPGANPASNINTETTSDASGGGGGSNGGGGGTNGGGGASAGGGGRKGGGRGRPKSGGQAGMGGGKGGGGDSGGNEPPTGDDPPEPEGAWDMPDGSEVSGVGGSGGGGTPGHHNPVPTGDPMDMLRGLVRAILQDQSMNSTTWRRRAGKTGFTELTKHMDSIRLAGLEGGIKPEKVVELSKRVGKGVNSLYRAYMALNDPNLPPSLRTQFARSLQSLQGGLLATTSALGMEEDGDVNVMAGTILGDAQTHIDTSTRQRDQTIADQKQADLERKQHAADVVERRRYAKALKDPRTPEYAAAQEEKAMFASMKHQDLIGQMQDALKVGRQYRATGGQEATDQIELLNMNGRDHMDPAWQTEQGQMSAWRDTALDGENKIGSEAGARPSKWSRASVVKAQDNYLAALRQTGEHGQAVAQAVAVDPDVLAARAAVNHIETTSTASGRASLGMEGETNIPPDYTETIGMGREGAAPREPEGMRSDVARESLINAQSIAIEKAEKGHVLQPGQKNNIGDQTNHPLAIASREVDDASRTVQKTLKDLAGALNGTGKVSEKTAKQVAGLMEELETAQRKRARGLRDIGKLEGADPEAAEAMIKQLKAQESLEGGSAPGNVLSFKQGDRLRDALEVASGQKEGGRSWGQRLTSGMYLFGMMRDFRMTMQPILNAGENEQKRREYIGSLNSMYSTGESMADVYGESFRSTRKMEAAGTNLARGGAHIAAGLANALGNSALDMTRSTPIAGILGASAGAGFGAAAAMSLTGSTLGWAALGTLAAPVGIGVGLTAAAFGFKGWSEEATTRAGEINAGNLFSKQWASGESMELAEVARRTGNSMSDLRNVQGGAADGRAAGTIGGQNASTAFLAGFGMSQNPSGNRVFSPGQVAQAKIEGMASGAGNLEADFIAAGIYKKEDKEEIISLARSRGVFDDDLTREIIKDVGKGQAPGQAAETRGKMGKMMQPWNALAGDATNPFTAKMTSAQKLQYEANFGAWGDQSNWRMALGMSQGAADFAAAGNAVNDAYSGRVTAGQQAQGIVTQLSMYGGDNAGRIAAAKTFSLAGVPLTAQQSTALGRYVGNDPYMTSVMAQQERYLPGQDWRSSTRADVQNPAYSLFQNSLSGLSQAFDRGVQWTPDAFGIKQPSLRDPGREDLARFSSQGNINSFARAELNRVNPLFADMTRSGLAPSDDFMSAVTGQLYPGKGNIEGAQEYTARANYGLSLASVGLSRQEAVLSRQFELNTNRPQREFQLGLQKATQFGGMFGGTQFTGSFNFQQQELDFSKQTTQIQYGRTVQGQQWEQTGMNIGREQQLLGREGSRFGMAYQQVDLQLGHQYFQQDWSLNQNKRQLQFGWQMEDSERSIRRATGFEKQQAIRERGRAVEMFNLDSTQLNREKSREELKYKREEERWNVEKKRMEEGFALEDKRWALEQEQFKKKKEWATEDLKREQEAHARQQKQLEESRVAAEMQYAKERERQAAEIIFGDKQHALQLARIGIQATEITNNETLRRYIDSQLTEQKTRFNNNMDTFETALVRALNSILKTLGGELLKDYNPTTNPDSWDSPQNTSDSPTAPQTEGTSTSKEVTTAKVASGVHSSYTLNTNVTLELDGKVIGEAVISSAAPAMKRDQRRTYGI